MPTLFDSLKLGPHTLKNRVIMAPMTRSRADAKGVLPSYAASYYGQRAGAGLIITEGTQPSDEGQGYARTPGIYTPAQIDAWRRVTDAVHAQGGRIFVQLMHVGRIAHPLNRLTDAAPVAPSAIQAAGTMYTDQAGMQPYPMPRALATEEIPGVIEQYITAAHAAFAAGFDGVEFHNGSGYLPNQFLESSTNQRTDRYGGSVENRARFSLEALDALAKVRGPEYVGVRLTPEMGFNDLRDDTPEATYSAFVKQLSGRGLAYLHVGNFNPQRDYHALLRPLYDGVYIAGVGFDAARADLFLREQKADAIAFGSSFIANPDLPERMRQGLPLSKADQATFYTPGEKGYTDYPTAA